MGLFVITTFLTFLLMALITILFKMRKKYSFWSDRGVPGPSPVPFFGNSLSMMLTSMADLDQQHRQKYGRIYGTYEGLTPVLVVSDPQVIQEICKRNFSSFADQFSTTSLDPMEMMNVAASSGDEWKKYRRIIEQCLSPHRTRSLLPTVSSSISDDIKQADGQHVNLCQLFSKHAVSTMLQLLWHFDLGLGQKDPVESERLITDLGIVFTSMAPLYSSYSSNFIISRISSWLSNLLGMTKDSKRATKYYVSIVDQLITERLSKENDSDTETRSDLLQSLIQMMQSSNLSREAVISNALTVAAVSWSPLTLILTALTYELAKDQKLQDDVRQELDDYLDQHDNVIELEDLPQLQLLDAVVQETLRFYPSEVHTVRRVSCKQGVTVPGTNIQLPHGSEIKVAFFALHFDPDLWTDPHVFDGRRFLSRDQSAACNYLPFGCGPRKCPASNLSILIIKSTMIEILRECTLKCDHPVTICVPPNSIEFDVEDIEVQFNKRADKNKMPN